MSGPLHKNSASHQALKAEAIEWFVRMRGEDAPVLRREFQAWLEQSLAHRHAFSWAETHFEASGLLRDSSRYGPGRPRQQPARIAWAIAATVILLLGTAYLLIGKMQTRPPRGELVLETGHGQIRTFHLSDGSSVTLDTDSKVDVAMQAGRRELLIRRGHVRVEVAPATRPLLATAAGGTLSMERGVFDLGYADGGVGAVLLAGHARIGAARAGGVWGAGLSLVRGRAVTYTGRNFLPTAQATTNVDRRDWPLGWVDYSGVSLDALVEQANRYAKLPILIDDPEVGALQVSGRFRLTDTKGIVRHVAEIFSLKVEQELDGVHLRRP